MKHRFSVLALCFVITLPLFSVPAFAYIYTDDPITDPYELRMIEKMEQDIMTDDDVSSACVAAGLQTLPLERAVRTYVLSPEEFLAQVEDGTFARPGEGARHTWEIPLYFDEETGAHCDISFDDLNGGRFQPRISSKPDHGAKDRQYLFYPETVFDKFYKAGIGKSAEIYVLSLRDFGQRLGFGQSDFVVAEENGTFMVLPQVLQPSFFKLNNETIIPLDEFAGKIASYIEGQTSPSRRPVGILEVLAGGFLLCAVVYCFWCYRWKKSKNSDHSPS